MVQKSFREGITRNATEKLLDILLNCGRHSYGWFIECLEKTGHDVLIQKMEESCDGEPNTQQLEEIKSLKEERSRWTETTREKDLVREKKLLVNKNNSISRELSELKDKMDKMEKERWGEDAEKIKEINECRSRESQLLVNQQQILKEIKKLEKQIQDLNDSTSLADDRLTRVERDMECLLALFKKCHDPQQATTTSFTDPQQTTTTSFTDSQQTTTTSFTDLQQTATTSLTDLQQTATTSFTDPQQTAIINSSDKTDDGVSSGTGSEPGSIYSTLHSACEYGNINDVKYLIDTGHDVNRLDNNNMSPILCCGESEIEPVAKLKLILTNGGNINDRDISNSNVLHLACLIGKLESVDFILKQGLDIHSRGGQYNRSPILCCGESKIEPVAKLKLILTNGGNIGDRDSNNNNVLHLACLYGKLESVDFILKQGLDIHSRGGQYNRSPILCCSESEIEPVAKLKLILTNGGNINDRDSSNSNVLHLACLIGKLESVDFILKQGLDIHSRGRFNRSPILCCGESKIEPVAKLKLILTNGGNIGDRDSNNNNVLHLACLYGKLESVDFILKQGLDIHSRGGQYNRSPILCCSESEIEPVAKLKLILTNGGNINDRDSSNSNVLHLACLIGKLESVDFILKQGLDIHSRGQYNRSPILYCSSSKIEPVAKLKLILTNGGNINDRDSNNNNVLHWACLFGKLESVDFILKQGLDIHSRGLFNRSPILCCGESKIEPVAKLKLILTNGGNIGDRDSNNNNVLHLACLYGKLESVDFILKQGLDIHSRGGQYNRSPILCCSESEIEPVAKLKLILTNGGNIGDRDSNNNNVLHLACLYSKLETVDYLLGRGVNINSKNKINQKPLDCCRRSSVQSGEKIKLLEAKRTTKKWYQW
ncbi:hypothetical protein SNE40_004167 [Patella caerulea]|uniref:Uncharacterized protein n=1 Tax=Patella caerulea TaxID=87958 RepID=A0AAN8KJW0_PATCE